MKSKAGTAKFRRRQLSPHGCSRYVLLHDIIGNQAHAFEDRVIEGDPARALDRMAQAIVSLRSTLPPPNQLMHRAVGLVRKTSEFKEFAGVTPAEFEAEQV